MDLVFILIKFKNVGGERELVFHSKGLVFGCTLVHSRGTHLQGVDVIILGLVMMEIIRKGHKNKSSRMIGFGLYLW